MTNLLIMLSIFDGMQNNTFEILTKAIKKIIYLDIRMVRAYVEIIAVTAKGTQSKSINLVTQFKISNRQTSAISLTIKHIENGQAHRSQ